jgi:oligopeptide transport system substrate-binding protein
MFRVRRKEIMTKRILVFLLSAAMLLSVFSACAKTKNDNAETSDSPAELTDYHTWTLQSREMDTFNILQSQSGANNGILANCLDSLLTNDTSGRLIANVADTWNTDDNGATWTFHIRDGVKWVDYHGNEMADCTAEDWLWGLEWVLNFWKNNASNTSMPIEMIAGAGDYYTYTKGTTAESKPEEIAAFEAICTKYNLPATPLTADEAKALGLDIFLKMVGIEAPDKSTLIYHCIGTRSYFPTVTTTTCLYPASHALIEKLGVDGFLACTWENMWYTGPYTITSFTQGNEKVLTKNPNYWNPDCKRFNTITYKMVESNDVAFQMYQNGELDQVSLTESNLQTISKAENNPYHDYLCEAPATSYSYSFHFCYDKKMTDGSPDINWNTAIVNEDFRLAWYYGLDLTAYLARTNAIHPLKCANYTYSAAALSVMSDGTDYTQVVRNKLGLQLPTDTYNRTDKDKFAQYKKQATEALTAKGVVFPIVADYYISGSDQTALDNATVLKQIFTDCLGDDFVQLNIKTYISSLSKEVRTPQLGSFYITGWSADYGDPQNFLGQETYGEDNAFFAVGYSKVNNLTDPDLISTYKEFTDLVHKANATVDDMDARYNAYADAEVFLIEHALVIPAYINVPWELTHVNDFSKPRASYGVQPARIVNWGTSVDGYSTEQYAALAAAAGQGK